MDKELTDLNLWQAVKMSLLCFLFVSIQKSWSVAVMPAKKTPNKRKSEAIVEDEKDIKKVKGKLLTFSKTRQPELVRPNMGKS